MPLRTYIRDLGTNADPAGMVREHIVLKQQVDALTVRIDAMKRRAREKVVTATRGLSAQQFSSVEGNRSTLIDSQADKE
jgi:hypothetical protein